VLPGVTVTATQTATGLVRSAVTDDTGTYLLSNLPTGPYRLEVSLQGFRSYVQTGLVLTVGATPTVNAVLELGSLEETITVDAATPLVDVRSAGISNVVEQERIVELVRHAESGGRFRGFSQKMPAYSLGLVFVHVGPAGTFITHGTHHAGTK